MSISTSWKCEVCGYVHKGDSPPDVCPVCGVDASEFRVFAAVATSPAATGDIWRCQICGFEHHGDAPPHACPVCGAGHEHFAPKERPAPTPSSVAPRIIIIGGGIAAVTAAEYARATSGDARIDMISKEGAPYYRLNLTRYLAGEIDLAALMMSDDTWFQKNRITRVDDEAASIIRDEKVVITATGDRRSYDKLILANGAHPFIPPIPGVKKNNVLPIRTLQHADAVLAAARNGARTAVCIGGGLLGLETAGALLKRGVSVIVLEGFPWLLPRQLPEPAGVRLAKVLERVNIAVRTKVTVEELVGDAQVRGVRLTNGEEIAADLVILSTGVRPNSYLARESGIKVNIGVLVDDTMTTSAPDILAAGDVAEHRGVVYGIWPAAVAQSAVAGVTAAGGNAEFVGLPRSNRLKVLDVHLFSIGMVEPTDAGFIVHETESSGFYRRLVVRDGHIVGAVLLGDTTHAHLLQEAVESGAQLDARPDLTSLFT